MTEYSLKVNGRITYVLGDTSGEAIAKLVELEKCEPDAVETLDVRDVEVYRRT
ncbi:hypothetical protein [Advenella kashmirensis]|uniref:hypothetical protein n=1 Tax=Advenella kashmirensis TaxID=310575 RepID=UPI001494CD89|nr:hypothetical protein [Advenella kashmirensis]